MYTRRLKHSLALLAALLLLWTASFNAWAQQSETPWQKIEPPGEQFSVMLPGKPEVENVKEPYGQLTLISNYYSLAADDGALFMIASLTGMQTLSALMSEKERLNSYTTGFRDSFLKEVRSKGLAADMTARRELTLNGHLGMEYDIKMGEISGLARVYSTRDYFYAVMIFNTLAGDKRVARFLDSFTLKAASPVEITVTTPAPANNKSRLPIRGGILNGKAVKFPPPDYPAIAKAARASGTVVVEITIDEEGNVVEASAVSGHPLLQQAAVNAAREAKFKPTRLSGQPVKVQGTLHYNFVLPKGR